MKNYTKLFTSFSDTTLKNLIISIIIMNAKLSFSHISHNSPYKPTFFFIANHNWLLLMQSTVLKSNFLFHFITFIPVSFPSSWHHLRSSLWQLSPSISLCLKLHSSTNSFRHRLLMTVSTPTTTEILCFSASVVVYFCSKFAVVTFILTFCIMRFIKLISVLYIQRFSFI